ncbi:universal stress protein PHOS34-like [Punica granatum]|uniref:Universal stress protein PHOS34-like n=1 Tax=Punica granatum TaxID=22663 RepID=A0A6P8BX24_PUNGR|nr:universal stress protein PHOS34-like [Punica granatum]
MVRLDKVHTNENGAKEKLDCTLFAGASVVLPIVGSDLRKAATLATEKPKKICDSKSVHQVEFEVVEGDARNVLCEAVEKHRAAILVVSSHGYGALKRAFLGSLSDYCIHKSSCSRVIVKKP